MMPGERGGDGSDERHAADADATTVAAATDGGSTAGGG